MATVDIELYYDLDRRRWTTSAGGLATQPSLFIGQSNTIDFKVRFVQGGVPIELTNPSFIAGVKVTDDPLGDYLLLTTTGTKTGAGATTIYTFTLNIDSVELQAYLVGITPTTNSTAFEVRDTVNNIATLPAITCSILPDYTLTGATPAAGSGTLVVDSGATFTVHKTFAMPTDDGFNNYVLKTNGAGVGSWAVDSAGTGTVTSVSVTTSNGVSGSVATSTTTPAITIALGAITPTTGAFSDATEATDSTTAPLKTAGGMAVAKSLYVGKDLWVTQQGYFDGTVEMTQPLIVPEFQDISGCTKLLLPNIASSVNYVAIENSVTSSPPHIYAQGTDANIGLHLSPKGTGFVNIEDGTDTTKRLRFSASGNSTGITTTLASSSTTSQTITLPNATAATTLAGLSVANTFTANQAFSGTISLVATTATAGQILQAGTRLLHTYGTNNLFVGSSAGKISGTIGSGNVSLGRDSLTSLTSGSNNTCLGDQSGYFITSGSSNMLVGTSAGVGISTGSQNIAMGVAALRFITSNSDCTAIGHQALYSTTGAKNTGIGSNASWTCTSGSKNTFIGEYSGASTDTIGGLTGIGITTGSNNTMLGQNTASTTAAGNYRTAIGSDSRCESNNAIKLGRDTLDVVLLPKMTQAQMATAAATLSAVKGAIVYCTDGGADADHVHFYNGTVWAKIN